MKRWVIGLSALTAALAGGILLLHHLRPAWASAWWWVLLGVMYGISMLGRLVMERSLEKDPDVRVQTELGVMVGRLLAALALLIVVVLSAENALRWPLGGGFLTLYFAFRAFDIWGRLPTLRAHSERGPRAR